MFFLGKVNSKKKSNFKQISLEVTSGQADHLVRVGGGKDKLDGD